MQQGLPNVNNSRLRLDEFLIWIKCQNIVTCSGHWSIAGARLEKMAKENYA